MHRPGSAAGPGEAAALQGDAVLFDFDGVLVDSTSAVEQAWGRWAAEHGLDPAAVLAQAHGVRTVETIRAVAPHLDAEAEARRIEEREERSADDVTAYPGAERLLTALPRDRWAIVTSGSRRLATARLQSTELPPPAVFVTADDVTEGKPAPDPYLLAAERLGVPARRCVVVEDSPAGVLAARSAGMAVIAVLTTHDAERLGEPTLFAGSIADIRVLPRDGELDVVVGVDQQV